MLFRSASVFALVLFGLANSSNAATTVQEGNWLFVFYPPTTGGAQTEVNVNSIQVQGSKISNPVVAGQASIKGKVIRSKDVAATITDDTATCTYVLDGILISPTRVVGIYKSSLGELGYFEAGMVSP